MYSIYRTRNFHLLRIYKIDVNADNIYYFLLNSYNAKYLFYLLFFRYIFIVNTILLRYAFYMYPLLYFFIIYASFLQFYHELYIYFLFIAIKQWLASAMWLKSIFKTAYALFAVMVCLSKYRNLHNIFAIYLLSPSCSYFQILLSKRIISWQKCRLKIVILTVWDRMGWKISG